MGFTTGLLSGITLTTTLLYLSLHLHTTTRAQQAALLSQQTQLLDRVTAPAPSSLHQQLQQQLAAREPRQQGVLENLKDRWNAELEANVRKVQGADWGALRERLEGAVGGFWGGELEKGREGVREVREEVGK